MLRPAAQSRRVHTEEPCDCRAGPIRSRLSRQENREVSLAVVTIERADDELADRNLTAVVAEANTATNMTTATIEPPEDRAPPSYEPPPTYLESLYLMP